MNKFSSGRVALGMLFAALGALISPLMLMFAGTCLWPPVLIALLYAWSGALPALVCAVLLLLSPALMVGMIAVLSGLPVPVGAVFMEAARAVLTQPTWMMTASLVLVLPGIATIALLRRRMPFFRAMACSIGAQLALIAAAVLALSLRFGPDLIGEFMHWFGAATKEMTSSGGQGVLLDAMMINMGQLGLFGVNTGIDFAKNMLTAAERTKLTELMVDMIDRLFRLNLVSMILTSGVTTGIAQYAFSARIIARRGDEPRLPYLHIHDWRLPRDMVIALPVTAIACAVMDGFKVQGMDAAYRAVLSLCYLAFAIQGVAALSRRFRQSGMPPGRRTMMIVMAVLFLQPISSLVGMPLLSLMGLWSAVLGSRGVLTLYMQKRNQTKGD